MTARGVEYEYETHTITYDARPRRYKPDFILPNGVIIEAKGRFLGGDRSKHLLIKKQFPELDIRFLFQADNPLSPKSKTRYSDWCKRHGFLYAFTDVPDEWLGESAGLSDNPPSTIRGVSRRGDTEVE